MADDHPLRRARLGPQELDPFEGAAELADLARQELEDLTHRGEFEVAVEVLGLLTAAAGPLTVDDLAVLSSPALSAPTAARRRAVRRVVEEGAARSLEPVGALEQRRYQFAHYSLLEYARDMPDLCDPEFRARIHRWADSWREAGWEAGPDAAAAPPRYLLDSYPATLTADPIRLSEMVGAVGWVGAAITTIGVDQVLATLSTAAPASPAASDMLALVTAKAIDLRPPRPTGQQGYVLRHLCLAAMERGKVDLADAARERLRRCSDDLVPLWTSRRTSPALVVELGAHDDFVLAVAALGDGRVASGGINGRVRLWDPATPGAPVVEVAVRAVALAFWTEPASNQGLGLLWGGFLKRCDKSHAAAPRRALVT